MSKPTEFATQDRSHVVTINYIRPLGMTRGGGNWMGPAAPQLYARCICEWGSVQTTPLAAQNAARGHVTNHESAEQEPNGTPTYAFNRQGLRVRLR
jgi:hypothetical protein